MFIFNMLVSLRFNSQVTVVLFFKFRKVKFQAFQYSDAAIGASIGDDKSQLSVVQINIGVSLFDFGDGVGRHICRRGNCRTDEPAFIIVLMGGGVTFDIKTRKLISFSEENHTDHYYSALSSAFAAGFLAAEVVFLAVEAAGFLAVVLVVASPASVASAAAFLAVALISRIWILV